MEAAIRELMGAGTPPRFKFKDTYASIEFPSGYTIPAQATLEAKYDELLALEEDIQKTVMEGDLEVGTSNLFVDTQTGNIGIGTTDPSLNLHVMGGIKTQNNGVLTPQIQFGSGANNTNGWLVRANVSDTYAGEFSIDRQDNSTTPNKFVIKNNGNVGIGTNNPFGKLQVDIADASAATATWDATKVVFGDITNGNSQGLGFGVSTNSHASIISLAPGVAWRGLGYYSAWHKWYINNVEKMVLDASGKVGIGTTSPSHPLTIQETTTNTNTVTYPLAIRAISSGTVANGFGAGIRFQCERRDTDDYQSLAGSVEVYGGGGLPGTSDLWNMRFGVRNNDTAVTPMTLRYDGNVGIGTANPLSELDIYNPAGTELIVSRNAGSSVNPTIRLWNFDDNNYNNHAVGTSVGTINFSGNERLNGDTHTDNSRAFSYANTLYDWARISALFAGSSDSATTSTGYVRGDLAFYTNNGDGATSDLQERMRIKHNGNVGIGLTGPESKLHIYGSDNPLMLQSQRSPYPKLSYDFSGTNAENFQFYDHHGSGRGFLYGRKYTTGTNPNANAGWHFYGNDNTLALRIDGSANVGIGTASPDTTLDVAGSINNGTYAINNGYMANRSLSIGDHALNYGGGNGWNSNTAGLMMECLNNTEIAIHDNGTRVASFMYFEGGSTNRFTIGRNMGWGGISTLALNGNVGIGTTSPNENLEIYGTGMRIHDPSASPKLDFVRGGTSRSPNTQSWGQSNYSDWRITADGPSLYFQNQYTGGNSGNLLTAMTIAHNSGNVGIGTTSPVAKLTLNAYGSENSTSCLIIGANTGSQNLRIGCNSSSNYCWIQSHQGKPLRLNPAGNSIQYGTSNTTLSDDRIKDNEVYIENATDTLLKLKPQVYDKKLIWNISKLGETSNVNVVRESGLITQDVWYDAPELRHLVHLGEGAEPGEDKPVTDNDPTIDPDYTSWGDNVSLIEYTGLIPYLIKSNQEIYTELQTEKTKVADLLARVEALENA